MREMTQSEHSSFGRWIWLQSTEWIEEERDWGQGGWLIRKVRQNWGFKGKQEGRFWAELLGVTVVKVSGSLSVLSLEMKFKRSSLSLRDRLHGVRNHWEEIGLTMLRLLLIFFFNWRVKDSYYFICEKCMFMLFDKWIVCRNVTYLTFWVLS